MAKGIYVGVGGAVRKMKTPYVGIGGVARKVKKVFVGVGGVKLAWSGEISKYTGTVTPLSVGRDNFGSGSIGNYVIFAGGYTTVNGGGNWISTADAYNTSLTRNSPSNSRIERHKPIGNKAGESYVIFVGGTTDDKKTIAFNPTLTRATPPELPNFLYSGMAGVSFGNYAFFSGGNMEYGGNAWMYTYAYNASLVITTSQQLYRQTQHHAGAVVNNHALFAGGRHTMYSDTTPISDVSAFNTSLVRSSNFQLSLGRWNLGSGQVSGYAIFAGGFNSGQKSIVDAYDKNLLRVSATDLSVSRNISPYASISVDGYAIFGEENGGNIDVYDKNLIRSNPGNFTIARRLHSGGSVGGYAIFAGGWKSSGDLTSLTSLEIYET